LPLNDVDIFRAFFSFTPDRILPTAHQLRNTTLQFRNFYTASSEGHLSLNIHSEESVHRVTVELSLTAEIDPICRCCLYGCLKLERKNTHQYVTTGPPAHPD
jgi:hypothetical protein